MVKSGGEKKRNQHKLRTSACANSIPVTPGYFLDLFLWAEQEFLGINALVNTEFLMLQIMFLSTNRQVRVAACFVKTVRSIRLILAQSKMS